MDKKVLRMIIITLVALTVTLLVVIFALLYSEKPAVPTDAPPESAAEAENLQTEPIDDPVGEDGFKVHISENGYTVKYPADMTAKKMAKAVDFILEDDNSGSSLNIVTAKNDGSVKKLSREEFEHSLLHMSEEAYLISYEETMLNGAEAVVAEYTYMGNTVKQAIVINDKFGYNITLTEDAYITDEMSDKFEDVINSFTLN